MFRHFKTQNDDSEIEARLISPEQSLQVPGTQSGDVRGDKLLDLVANLSQKNGMCLVQHGARLAVIGELLAAMLMHLSAATRADIVESFRNRIEELMALGDDKCFPEKYLSALLTEINRYLNVLR